MQQQYDANHRKDIIGTSSLKISATISMEIKGAISALDF